MNKQALVVWMLLLGMGHGAWSLAASNQVKAIQWQTGPRARLVIDVSNTPSYQVARAADASHLTIELGDTALATGLVQPGAGHPVAAHIGSLPGRTKDSLRLMVELKNATGYQSHLETLKDRARLVVEWATPAAKPVAAPVSPVRNVQPKPANAFVVAIDAGHGGKDTGAIGHSGILEKDVVLAIARKLAGFIRAEPGMKVVMIRKGDEFVDLHHRARLARHAKADLFVSVHADAFNDNTVKGSSVFTLSDNGASSEAARWLADSENAALLGGAKLKSKDKTLTSVLVDLSKNATLDASDRAAEKVLRELRKDFSMHHDAVQKAGFAVLKSLDVPSMLVETAFISNPDEERNLTNPRHQEQIARAVFRGIRAYAAETRPAVMGLRVAGDGDM